MRSRFVSILLLSAGLLLAVPAGAVTLTRGPYVQKLGPDAFTLHWRTDVASSSRVRWGWTPGSLDSVVVDSALTTEHVLRIGSLPAATPVHYAVGTLDSDLGVPAPTAVETAPPVGDPAPLRIWVTGDSGLAGADQAAVRDAFLSWTSTRMPDLWLLLGDNAYDDGTDAEYQAAFFEPYAMLLPYTALWSTRGNHDRDPLAGPGYFDVFDFPTAGECGGVPSGTESYYSFDHGNVHFVSLDTFSGDLVPPSPMLDWLVADLNANGQDWTVVFTHYPPYSKGSHDSDTDWAMSRLRENFLPSFDALGVDLVLSGHSHGFERSYLLDGHYGDSSTLTAAMLVDSGNGERQGDGAYRKPTEGPAAHEGCVYAVVGSSSRVGFTGSYDHSAMATGGPMLGSLVLEVEGLQMQVRFLDAGGVTRDHFTLLKGAPVGTPVADAGDLFLEVKGGTLRPGSTVSLRGIPAARIGLELLDLRGRRLRRWPARGGAGGARQWVFDGRDARGATLARGIYLLRTVGAPGGAVGRKVSFLR